MKFFAFYKKYGIYIILLVLAGFFCIFAPQFLSVANLLNVLRQVSIFGIVVVGVTFTMISGGPDLSVGGQVAVIGMIGGILMVNLGAPIYLTIPVCMAVGIAFGMINGFLTVRLNMFSMIVTLGTMLMLQGIAYVITGGYPVFGLPEDFTFLGQGYVWIIPVPVIIFAVAVTIGWFVLNKTYFGRYVCAIGGNPEAARLAGINVDRMRVAIFGIAGFMSSIASLIMLSRTNAAQPGAGASYPFDSLTAAVLGGISFAGGEGSIGGAIVGVLILGILDNGLILMDVASNWQNVIKGFVLIAAVGIDSIQKKQKKVRLSVA